MSRLRALFVFTVAVLFAVSACQEAPTAGASDSSEPLNLSQGSPSSTSYHPVTPSQLVECELVDRTIARIPRGDGDGTLDSDETGPGGWFFAPNGRSFVTFAFELDDAGTPGDPSDDVYQVDAGRSAVAANSDIINDYPEFLDLPQGTSGNIRSMSRPRDEITLVGVSPEFELPGKDGGKAIISVTDPDGDGVYEGCAERPLRTLFGFLVTEGGDLLQHEYFKVFAETDETDRVTFWEFTEISIRNIAR